MRVSDIETWPGEFGNWGRWDGFQGTMNLITADRVLAGIGAVDRGEVFACSHELTAEDYPEELSELHGFDEPGVSHQMLSAAEFEDGKYAAADRVCTTVHSLENTHLDALAHVGHLGKGFNGIDFDDMVDVDNGAKVAAITEIPAIVTRGVLVDVPRLRGVEYVEPGDWVRVEELEEGAPNAEPGDALIVRTGRWDAPTVRPDSPGASGDIHGDWAGLHVDCMGFVADRDVAVVGTDSTGDTFPLPTPDLPTIHILAEVYLGLPLLHSMVLDDLAAACAEAGRNEFLFAVAPLNIPNGTGSLVTPICVL